MIDNKISELSNFLIRPNRRTYDLNSLGPTNFTSRSQVYNRIDFQVKFSYPTPMYLKKQYQLDKQNSVFLKCSIFIPQHHVDQILEQKKRKHVCILAAHGNSGSRMSTISTLPAATNFQFALAIFDFAGCGNSEGDFVTLGYYQRYQIESMIEAIAKNYGYRRFILYGRSMGAASTLFFLFDLHTKYLEENSKKQNKQVQKNEFIHYQIIGSILDSPYCNTNDAFMDMLANRAWYLPKFLLQYLLKKVDQRAGQRLMQVGIFRAQTQNQKEKIQNCDENQKMVSEQEIKSNQKASQISLLSDINYFKTCQQYLPLPIYVLYGLKDNVISQKHTWSLFQSLNCLSKKLHVLVDQGHGSHRSDQLKIAAINWILSCNPQEVWINKEEGQRHKKFEQKEENIH